MGDSPKWVKSKRRRKKKERERAKVGDNNGQATHGARKPPGPKATRQNCLKSWIVLGQIAQLCYK